jgi:broad specificity phosphatase PhoE
LRESLRKEEAMRRLKTRLHLLTLMILCTAFFTGCTTTVTPVYLLRHAEKGYGTDPNLTPAGQARAEELRRILENVFVAAVYSTDTNRTRQTAQPLAAHKGLTTVIYSDSSVAGTILAHHEEQIVVVVGHSNTVPQLITAFGGTTPYSLIPGNEFDNLFLLIVEEEKGFGSGTVRKTKVFHMKYGAVSN